MNIMEIDESQLSELIKGYLRDNMQIKVATDNHGESKTHTISILVDGEEMCWDQFDTN
jgi:hypothetical protein